VVKHCKFYWGNQAADGGGNFSLQPGVSPSRGILRFQLRQRVSDYASLILTDNETATATFTNCRMTRYHVPQSDGGRWAELTFVDRRWKWEKHYYAVYGEYNRWGDPYQKTNQRTARQLAAILLDALGESGYDVSALPNTTGPSVAWDAANPASELDILCAQYGCLVTLNTNNRISIYREGYGRTPTPDARQMDFTQAKELSAVPKALVFEAGRTHIQFDLPLAPVTLETSTAAAYAATYKQLVGIDQVSYAPPLGWGVEDPVQFFGVNPRERPFARRHVWRTYSISGPVNLPKPPANMMYGSKGKATSIVQQQIAKEFFEVARGEEWRLLPLNEFQNGTSYAPRSNTPAPQVIGWFYKHGAANVNVGGYQSHVQLGLNQPTAFNNDLEVTPIPRPANNPAGSAEFYPGKYDIDLARGIVEFEDPIYFKDFQNNKLVPPVIRLRCSFPLRDPDTAAFLCQQFWNYPGSPIAGDIVKIVKRSDSFFEYSTTKNNYAQFLADALENLNVELNQYQNSFGYSAPYKGFVFDIPPDGIVRTVTWDVSDNGQGTTHIDFNMERPEAYATLQEARNERLATYNFWLESQLVQKRIRGIIK
jgi:hypothetical protein